MSVYGREVPPLEGRKKNIEWSQFSWNWTSGCPGPKGPDGECLDRCPYCYAQRMAMRQRGRFGYPKEHPFEVVLHENKLYAAGPWPRWSQHPLNRGKPAVYFSVSMGDWLSDLVDSFWRREALRIMERAKQHIFVTLTKQYNNLHLAVRDSPEGKIPENVIIGITITKKSEIWGIEKLKGIDAVRLLCHEPALEDISDISLEDVDWLIIGAQTKQPSIGGLPPVEAFMPKKAWIQRLVYYAAERNLPVFLKPNLGDYVGRSWFAEKIEDVPFEKMGWGK